MQWTDLTRRLARLSAASTLALAACGGGDKNLGPETGGDVETWEMVAIGTTGLPAAAEVEDCRLTRFDHGTLETKIKDFCEAKGVKLGDMNHILRVATTGVMIGPGVFEILAILGKDEVLRRMQGALELAR